MANSWPDTLPKSLVLDPVMRNQLVDSGSSDIYYIQLVTHLYPSDLWFDVF